MTQLVNCMAHHKDMINSNMTIIHEISKRLYLTFRACFLVDEADLSRYLLARGVLAGFCTGLEGISVFDVSNPIKSKILEKAADFTKFRSEVFTMLKTPFVKDPFVL